MKNWKAWAGPTAFGALCAVLLILFCVWWSGVESDAAAHRRAWAENPSNPINVCVAKGGVPVTSAWDGRLKECQFAPK